MAKKTDGTNKEENKERRILQKEQAEAEKEERKREKRDNKVREKAEKEVRKEERREEKRGEDINKFVRREEKRDSKAREEREKEERKAEREEIKAARRAEIEKRLLENEKRNPNQIRYSRGEEMFNRISHLVGAALSGLGSAFAIYKTCLAYGEVGALGVTSVCLFSVTLLLLYIMSTLYHWRRVGSKSRSVFRRFDHCSIALLIAGTYAPFMLIGMYSGGGTARVWAIVLAAVVLAFAVLSCVFNAIDVNKFKVFSLISYVVMGWACVVRIDLLIKTIALPAFILLLAGGVVYTIGIIFYRMKSIPWNHAIWHLFVMGGTALHFLAVYLYIIP